MVTGSIEAFDRAGTISGNEAVQRVADLPDASSGVWRLPSFASGTRITTPRGMVPVEALRVGDTVLTRDNGARPLRWIGARRVPLCGVEVAASAIPVRLRAGALGAGAPVSDLTISGQHRLLVRTPAARPLCGEDEALVAAVDLTGRPGISLLAETDLVFVQLLLDRHEIILANGLWVETIEPQAALLEVLPEEDRRDLSALIPDLAMPRIGGTSARPALSAAQAAMLP